jgi:putative hemolysin
MPSRSGREKSPRRRWPTQLDPARLVPAPLQLAVRRALGLDELMRLHGTLLPGLTAAEFADAALELLGISVESAAKCFDAVPRAGPVVFVGNHPHGALDGLVAISRLSPIRPDLRVLANFELASVAQLAPIVFPLDPYGGSCASTRNAASLRRALRWLRSGRSVLLFPSGQVARFDVRTGRSSDPPWQPAMGRWLRLAGAPIVPLHIDGSNSATFHLLSLIHPGLGTLLLPRELIRQRGRRVALTVGPSADPAKLAASCSDEELIAQLRMRVEMLWPGQTTPAMPADATASQPSVAAHAEVGTRGAAAVGAMERHCAEIERLPADALLARSGCLRAYLARPGQIPHLLLEIGRLREQTFRAVGEGTGREIDVDLFDNYYDQLILWDASAKQIVGGYRIGRVDEIRRAYGKRGLYTQTLFDYREPVLTLLGSALELGRSFVREEWQRSYAPLLLLWRGIGEYVAREPRYCRLIGPVSISQAYQPLSRDMLIDWLRISSFDAMLAPLVRPRQRYRRTHALRTLGPHTAGLCSVESLSALISDLEPDGKGVPVLLRHYLRLGGRILGFNVDPAFSNAVDCLLLLDLRHTDRTLLRKYMSADGLRQFDAAHARTSGSRRSA